MSQSTDFINDLAEYGLLENTALSDPRWMELLGSVYTRLNQLSSSRAIADALPDAVLSLDINGGILDINQTTYAMFGKDNGAITNLTDIVPASVALQIKSAIHNTTQSQLTTKYEFSLDGIHFRKHFEARIFPLNGKTVILIFREITEQRWSHVARAFTESYFRSLVQQLNIGLLICTPEGDIVIANNALLRMLGQNDEQLVGLNYLSLLSSITGSPETLAELKDQYEKAKTGKPCPLVTIRVNKPEQMGYLWLLVNLDMELNSEYHTRQLKVMFTDITDFRNAEIALKESEEQYAALVDRVTDVIYQLDDHHEIIFLNSAWMRLTGFRIEDTLGRSLFDFVHPQDNVLCANALRSGQQSDMTDIQLRLLKQDSSICWITLRNQMIQATDGTVVGHYGMMIDITDQKRNEATRAALTAKAHTVEILTRLLANISHDLRTPISIISVASYKLRQYWQKLDEARRLDSFDQIDQQVSRIIRFVEEYSDLARIDVELANVVLVPINLTEVISEMVQTMMHQPTTKSIRWELKNTHNDQIIMGSIDWLKKMIGHVLDNATQYTADEGQITVRVHRKPSSISLDVQDTGIGIPPSDIEHVFEPLYRADKARSVNESLAGLGLTFVQRIAQVHNAKLHLQSEVGVGTTVSIDFPLPEGQLDNQRSTDR